MAFKGVLGDNRIFAIIAIIIIVIILLTVLFSSNQLREAKIEGQILGDNWNEDISESQGGSNHFGLEKWVSYTYRNDDLKFPSYVTVTSIKTLFMMGEEELNEKTIDTINQATNYGIIINENSKETGIRALNNGHKTIYTIYDGNNTYGEQVKIIGESWNCAISGTSVICIGISQITNNSEYNDSFWARIIRDEIGTFGIDEFENEDGLIFNVKCH